MPMRAAFGALANVAAAAVKILKNRFTSKLQARKQCRSGMRGDRLSALVDVNAYGAALAARDAASSARRKSLQEIASAPDGSILHKPSPS
jgi:hypothetical protein